MTTTFEPDRSPAAPFFKTPIPLHDPPPLRPLPSRVLATWPENTFVENILARADGSLLVSVHSAHELHRWREGRGIEVLTRMPASPAAVNAHPRGGVVVIGGNVGVSPQFAWHVTDDGIVSEIARLPEALFFNGGAPFLGGHLLAVDSILGRMYDVDLIEGTIRLWFAHELLEKVTGEPMLPGVNGIKVFGNHVYVSNTDRALFLRIPFDERGAPGRIEIVAERLRADDFAFAADGTAYLTTHIHNSLLRLDSRGERVDVASAGDGMAGSTAVTFGATPDTARSLFVTTTGGILAPVAGVVQPAKLIRMETEES